MSESFFFLAPDLAVLEADIRAVGAEIKKVQGDTAESTEQTSETWHDNFMFEDGQRQMDLLASRLASLNEILAKAVIVVPRTDGSAGVGNRITIRDEATGEERTYTIGSYVVGKQNVDTVSYTSPLGALLFGAKVGDIREGIIGSIKRRFTIVDVQ